MGMGEPNILGTDLAENIDPGVLQTQDGLRKCDVQSQRLFQMMKCSMLKLALDGADKVIKDQRALKTNLDLCETQSGLASELGEERRSSLDSSERNAVEGRRDEAKSPLQENERVCRKSGNQFPLLYSGKHLVNVSEMVNSPLGSYNPFPLNILAFIAALLMKIIGFQLSLVVSLFAFPVRVSYLSFMLLLFPIQTLGQIRGYFMKRLLRMWSVTSANVTTAVSERLQAQKSLAVNVGLAFFRSTYVCSMLLGILASGFVLSGFIMRHIVEKPIQTTETLNFDYTKSSPAAFVPLMSSSGITSDRAIPYRHKLQLAVSLTVPESEYNHNLGVFQVTIEFLSANGNVTARSSYPCMLRFKSGPIHFVETLLKTAPLIAGLQSETQVLNIKMSTHNEGLEPTACMKVILEQRAEFQSGAGIPQIYGGLLVLQSELPQLKRLVWYWRRTIFVWTSIMLFLTELVFILALFRPIILPRGRPKIGYSARKVNHSNILFWNKSRN